MDYQSLSSLTAMFFAQAARLDERPLLWRKREGQWQSLSWRAVAQAVRHMAQGLRAAGLQNGARVLLVSESRPEWLIADLAIMAAGGITVPAYTTNTAADHLHLLNNSGASMVIVSSRALVEKVIHAGLKAEHPPLLIVIEELALRQNPGLEVRHWSDLMAQGAAADPAPLPEAARTDTACIIYTSGTGGAPKGVMLSHGAILSNCQGAHRLLEEIGLADNEIFLSFLPLSHAYEHTAGQFFPLSIGAQIYYAEGLEQLAANMAEVRPTIMTAVPRLYEMIRGRVLKGVAKSGGLKAWLFQRALLLGGRRVEGRLSLPARLENALLDRLVRRKVALRFGGRLKALVSGGAPLNYDVGLFFTALGVRILQGYGQTEAAPLISCNPPRRVKLKSVGPAVHGVELRIAADGEICVRGELVMQGYWNDAEATRAVLHDGWLHTGDIGHVDEDGYIHITDRKKDILVNSGGDNVSPQRIEGLLTLQPEIAQAMAYGDRRPHLVALLVPDADEAAAWAAARGLPTALGQLIENRDFRAHISQAVDRVNQVLAQHERIRRMLLTADPFTVDNGMSTPTLKIRRHVIVARYGEALAALYEERKGG